MAEDTSFNRGFSVWSLDVLSVTVWVPYRFSDFLPQSRDLFLGYRSTDESELATRPVYSAFSLSRSWTKLQLELW